MEAELVFEKEEISGVAVVGTALIDAGRRVGVSFDADCGRLGLCETCAVRVTAGSEFLSAPTRAELDQLSAEQIGDGLRLTCQAKITESGRVVCETLPKKDPRTEEQKLIHDFQEYFAGLPLEGKVGLLLDLESMVLNETLSFVANSPYKIGERVIDLLSRYGYAAGQRTAPPEEDQANVGTENGANEVDSPNEDEARNA